MAVHKMPARQEEQPIPSQAVSFQRISRILEVTDAIGLDRERVEIPLAPENPGLFRRRSTGELEIIVDADHPFDRWLTMLPTPMQLAQGS